jgi:hypothetical protein
MTQPDTPRVRANRLNALKSTGPRSFEGKRISSRNGLKHGLCSKTIPRLGPRDRRRFDELQRLLRVRFMPEGDIEEKLFTELSVAMWNQDRLQRQARYKRTLEMRVSYLFLSLQALRGERLAAGGTLDALEPEVTVSTHVPA